MSRLASLLCSALVALAALIAPTTAGADTVYKTYEGTGDRVIRLNLDSVSLVKARHSGEQNFAIWAVNRAGKKTQLLVNAIGSYKGTTLVEAAPKRRVRALAVTADGSWTIATKALAQARVWRDTSIKGTGDDVLRVRHRKLTMKAVYRGKGNFIIWALNRYGRPIELLVNEIGRYRGTTLLPSRTRYIAVTAETGDIWRLIKR